MAETKIEAVRLLLQDPYRHVMLQDYNKAMENHKFRKKLEGIENEISWFNGKSNHYKTEDRKGFFEHFQKNYAGRKHAPMGPMYRSITTFNIGEEPELVYFMMIFVKKNEEFKELTKNNPDPKQVQENQVLRLQFVKLRNEIKLLNALLTRLDKAVGAFEVSITECFITDFMRNAEKLPSSVLVSRFYRSLRRKDTETPLKLVELIKQKGETKDADYLEAVAVYNARDYKKLVEVVDALPKDHEKHSQAAVMRTEACAKLGDIKGFISSFDDIGDDVIDTVHFLYLLQELITHAPYAQLDDDAFDSSVQELLKRKFKQDENSMFAGAVSRNFVSYLVEGLPIAAELAEVRKEKGEGAIDEKRLDRLYQLQMALDLYPNDDVSSIIDLDTIDEKGVNYSREKIGRIAIKLLIENSKEKSFENIYLAFNALYAMQMTKAFAKNVETNLDSLKKYGKAGFAGAYDLIKRAVSVKKENNEDAAALEEALKEAGIE